MDFCNRITNQSAIYYAQSRGLEMVLPCASPKRRRSSSIHSTTKDWVLRAFYSGAKTADVNSSLSVATQLPNHVTNHATGAEKDHKRAKAVEDKPMLPVEPAVKFKQARIDSAAGKLKFSLVGKFPRSRPSLKQIRTWASARLRLSGQCRITLLDRNHVLIRLDNEEDMHSVWLRNRWSVRGHLVKVFRWTPEFRPSDGEPSSAPVWVSFPSLPVVYFDRGLLYDIASLLGRVLSMDAPTRKLSRTDRARVCVELDLLRQEHAHRVWIGVEDKGFWQAVKYEKMPSYCTSCREQGHSVEACGNLMENASASQRILPNLAVHESNVVAKEAKSNLRKLSVEKHCQTCPTILEMNEEDKLVMNGLPQRKFDSLVCMKQVIEGKGEGGREQLINSSHPMLQDQQRFQTGSFSRGNIVRAKEKPLTSVEGIKHGDKTLLIQEEMKEEEELVDTVEEGRGTEKVDIVQDLELAGGHVEEEQVIRNYLLSPHDPSGSRKRKTIFFWKKKRQPVEFVGDTEEEARLSRFNAKRFQLRELLIATDGFSEKNILGRGGFGKTYKGRLADGSLVAVKRAKEEKISAGTELQFRTEVELLSIALHKNICPLIGYCMSRTERLLVYPYMANGDLGERLRARPLNAPPLDWPSRMRIAVGTAEGLAYLHEQMNIKIIHRDVKAANILLNDEFEAVISDFGLTKRMNLEDSFVTTNVRGTLGHMAPEYLSTGKISEKTDVFGYGILLLELMTGQRAFDLARMANDYDVMLFDWVKGLLKEKALGMIVDPDLKDNNAEAEVEQLILVALLCTQGSAMERPKMSEVVRLLGGYGLVERWERWQKTEDDRINSHRLPSEVEHAGWLVDSTDCLQPEELSSCR